MSDKIQDIIESLNRPSAAAELAKKTPKKTDKIGQEEFLNMLVSQLKNQDPLNPMDSQNFASQLAQFSQLEQLVNINKTLSSSAGNSVSSMSSFLGHEVILKDANAKIEGGNGPNLTLTVPEELQAVRLDIIKSEGGVARSLSLDASKMEPGKRVYKLEGLAVDDGDYTFRIVGVNNMGVFKDIDYKITGTVEGFMMDSTNPKLIVNGKEVSLDDISEVIQGSSKT